MSLNLLLSMSIALYDIGVPYRKSGSIAPAYTDLRAACWSPQLILPDFIAKISIFTLFSHVVRVL